MHQMIPFIAITDESYIERGPGFISRHSKEW